MTPENTKLNSKGWRICRACRSAGLKRDRDKNREARNAKTRAWHASNKERVSQHHKAARKRIQDAILLIKSVPCMDCGNEYPSVCMDFDHIRGDKTFNISQCKSLKDLNEEAAKCDVVCANCHRIRTWLSGRERPWEKISGRKPSGS
jgi:hypothetical protein